MLKAKDFRQRAWGHLSGNWSVAVVAFLVMGVLQAALAFTAVGTLLITGPLTLGFTIITLGIVRGGQPEIGDLFSGFNDFVRAFLLSLLNAIFIALWSLLFVIPGIIKYYSYSMSFFILKDNPELSANEARKESMRLMHGNKWRLFCLDFSFIGWLLLCGLTFGILTLWVSPYMQVAHAEFYESLKSVPAAAEGTDSANDPPAQEVSEG